MTNAQIHHPKISVLIPVFNRKDYITECIQSAQDQTFTDIEIIVVDNASDDGTWEICQQFAITDKRVRILRNETNIGPVSNWIRCAQEAKGALTKILFSDDCLEPNCLSEMVPKLDDPDVAFVYCAARIGKSRDESVVTYSQVDSSRLNSTQFLNRVIGGTAPVSPGAVLLRTHDVLKNLHTTFPTSTPRKFEENGAGPDVMIMLLTARDYLYIANISAQLVFFRAHADSFSTVNSKNSVVKGYQSAIFLFLKRNYSHKVWLHFLAHAWIKQMYITRSYRSPIAHLIEFEGVGNISEIIALHFFATKYLANVIYLKLMRSLSQSNQITH